MHFDYLNETVKGIEQNMDDAIKICEDSVISELNMDENIESFEKNKSDVSDPNVFFKGSEENIDTSHEQAVENVQERNDKDRRCIDKEPVINEKNQFLVSLEEKENNNMERFEDRDNQDASQSAMSEETIKKNPWMMSNKGVEQDGHMYEEKSLKECQKSVSSAIEDVQPSQSEDRALEILEYPVILNKHEISSGSDLNCYGNENTSANSIDQNDNDLLENLNDESSRQDPFEAKEKNKCSACGKICNTASNLLQHYKFRHTEKLTCKLCNISSKNFVQLKNHMSTHVYETADIQQGSEHKKVTISNEEFETVEDLEGSEMSYSTQLVFPTESKASHGDVGKEKTVKNDDRNLFQTSANKCDICGLVCRGQARMVKHLRVHSEERPFDCKVCGFKYKYKDSLERHQKRHKSSKQRNTKSPHNKQIQKSLEQSKRNNSEYLDFQRHFQSFVTKNRDKVKCMLQTEGIDDCSSLKDNFAEKNVCKKMESSSVLKDYVNSNNKFLKGDEMKLISSLDTVISTEPSRQSTVEIFACSVVLDKINLREDKNEVYLKHCTKEKLPTSFTPVQIQSPPGWPVKRKMSTEKEGSTDSVEKCDPHGGGSFKCPLCGKSYFYRKNLNRHTRDVHPEDWNKKRDICRFGGRLFYRKINFCQHEQMHVLKRQNATKSQAEHQSSSSKSKNHKPQMNSDEISDASESHKCRFCGKMFSRRINLIQHEQVHIQNKRSKHVKLIVDKVYLVESDYQKRSVGSGKKPSKLSSIQMNHKCRFCFRQFFRRCDLCQHEPVCHRRRQIVSKQKSENSNSAETVNFSSKKESISSTENPLRAISTNKLPKCQYCGKFFSQKWNLKRHLKLHNQKRKFFKQENANSRSAEANNFGCKKESISSTESPLRVISTNKLSRCRSAKANNSSAKKTSLKSVRNQLKIISTENQYLCEYCGMLFSQKWDLSQHLQLHQYLCEYCGMLFSQKWDLSQHLQLHNQKKTQLKQGNIMNSFSLVTTDLHTDTSESSQNVNKENVNKTPHICRFCGRCFTRRLNLCQHEQSHNEKDRQVHKKENVKSKTFEAKGKNKCSSCGKICNTISNLLQHYQFRHTEKLTCKLCNISSKNLVQLKNHMSTHVYEMAGMQHQGSEHNQQVHKLKTVSSLQNRCSVCAKICRNKSDLFLHYEFRHTESLKCKICNTFLKTYVELREHMRTHVGFKTVDMKELSCLKKAKDTNDAYCPKKIEVGKRSCILGKSCEQKKSKKHKCIGCCASFNTHFLLSQHKKKPVMSAHACFVCGKTFRRKFHLAMHLRIHTGDQPHECDICLKGFLSRHKLAEHMRTHIQMEANEFQCERCKALFCDQQSILNHLKSTHTTHQKISHLNRQIIYSDNGEELQSNEHVAGRENTKNDTAIYDNIQNEKPIFFCGICGEAYAEASCLYIHMGNHAIESTDTENGKIKYITDTEDGKIKYVTERAESGSSNRQMDSYTYKLEAQSAHKDVQNLEGHVPSDFVDNIKNETFSAEASGTDSVGSTFDQATESLSDEYIDVVSIGDTVDPPESVSEFQNVNPYSEKSERTSSVNNNRANTSDMPIFIACSEQNKWFKCDLCLELFSSQQSLSLHKRWHEFANIKLTDQIKKDLYCTFCKIYFSSRSHLEIHLNWHKRCPTQKHVISSKISIPLSPYTCEKCGKTFASKKGLVQHKHVFDFSSGMTEGEMKVSDVPNGFICEICGHSYSQRSYLIQHILCKHNLVEKNNFEAVCDEKEQPFKCQLCGKVFLNEAELAAHIQMVHIGKNKAYSCSFCNKEYIQRDTLLLHTLKFHPNFYPQVMGKMAENPSNQKQCRCCKTWYNPNDNTGHEDGFKCESCENVFSCKRCFIEHLNLPESAELESIFWCCVCEIYFMNRKGLKDHVPLHASDLGNYRCRKCSQVFKYKQHLFRHKKEHGFGSKYSWKESYICKWCYRAFPNECAMRLHEKTKHKSEQSKCKKTKKRQVQVNPRPYNCVDLADGVELSVVSIAGVGSDVIFSDLPKQQDGVALNTEVQNDIIVHNSDTNRQDFPLLNSISFDTAKFDLSAAVELKQGVEQDDIQSSFEDPTMDELDIHFLDDSNNSQIDRLTSNMHYFVRSAMENSQYGSSLSKETLEKHPYSEVHSSHKNPPLPFNLPAVKDIHDFDEQRRSTGLPQLQVESSNNNDHSYSLKPPNDSEDNANEASKEEGLEVSKGNHKSPEKPQDVWSKVVSDHSYHQEDQIAEDSSVSPNVIKKKTLVKVSCLKCLRVFTRLTDLRNHMKVHSEKNFLSFTSYADLNEKAPKSRDESTAASVNQEHKEQIQCFICHKLVYSQELVRHLQSHADLKLYECKHCDECFASATSYSEHMKQNYGEIVCCACGETFTERKDLIIHLKKHNFDVILKCSICRAIFTSHDTFSKHLEIHVISQARPAESRNDKTDQKGSKDTEASSSEDREKEENYRALMEGLEQGDASSTEDREEEEENLRALMEGLGQGDAGPTLSSGIIF